MDTVCDPAGEFSVYASTAVVAYVCGLCQKIGANSCKMIDAVGFCHSPPCLVDRDIDGQRASSASSDSEGLVDTASVVAGIRLSPAGAEDDTSCWTTQDATHLSVGSSSSCPGQFSRDSAANVVQAICKQP